MSLIKTKDNLPVDKICYHADCNPCAGGPCSDNIVGYMDPGFGMDKQYYCETHRNRFKGYIKGYIDMGGTFVVIE